MSVRDEPFDTIAENGGEQFIRVRGTGVPAPCFRRVSDWPDWIVNSLRVVGIKIGRLEYIPEADREYQ